MGEFFAIEGMTLVVNHPTVQANISIIDPASSVLRGSGGGVYRDGTQISVSNITDPSAGATIPDAGPYVVSLNATSLKNKTESLFVLRENDLSDTINATPRIPGSPSTPYPVSFDVIIQAAGQVKLRGE